MAKMTYTKTGALLSKDGRYRYELTREWNLPDSARRRLDTLGFIMLNPSTADAAEDDPTIRRCVAFARAAGASRLVVTNLFAYRATEPAELVAVRHDKDIVGPEYWDRLSKTLDRADRIIIAWGNHGKLLAQDAAVISFIYDTPQLGRKVYYLDLNKDGSPKHPLYVKSSVKPAKYIPKEGYQ